MIAMKQRGITDAGRGSVLLASAASLVLVVIATDARAQAQRGSFVYASAEQCASDRKISQEFCANAAANAAAEFDEKAPRFPAREACERVFGAGRCSLGFGGPGAGPKSKGVYFSPRMQSFSIKVVHDRDMSVTPVVTGLNVSPRSILRRDTHINPAVAQQARQNLQPQAAGPAAVAGGGAFGVARPDAPVGPVPPRPSLDPNFDCASVLEPGARGGGDIGCYPAKTH